MVPADMASAFKITNPGIPSTRIPLLSPLAVLSWKRALITSHPPSGDLPHRDGCFSGTRCSFNFLRASNIDDLGGVRDRRFALAIGGGNGIPGHRVYGRARRARELAMGRGVGES